MEVTAPKATESSAELLQLLREGKSDEQIRAALIARHGDTHVVPELMREVGKLRSSRNMSLGLAIVLSGALILLVSFIMAILRFHSNDSLSFVLYGLTSLGILVVFFGLMKIFG